MKYPTTSKSSELHLLVKELTGCGKSGPRGKFIGVNRDGYCLAEFNATSVMKFLFPSVILNTKKHTSVKRKKPSYDSRVYVIRNMETGQHVTKFKLFSKRNGVGLELEFSKGADTTAFGTSENYAEAVCEAANLVNCTDKFKVRRMKKE